MGLSPREIASFYHAIRGMDSATYKSMMTLQTTDRAEMKRLIADREEREAREVLRHPETCRCAGCEIGRNILNTPTPTPKD